MHFVTAQLFRSILLCLTASIFVGCFEEELILPGKREAVLVQTPSFGVNEERNTIPPDTGQPVNIASSGHPGISSGHDGGHLMLDLPLRTIWSASLESADSELNQLPQPVIAGGRLFAIGGGGRLTAFDLENGKRLWSAELNPEDKDIYPGIVGAVAASEIVAAAHASRNTLSLFEAETGALIWEVSHDEVLQGGPTLVGSELVAVSDIDGRIFVYRLADGELFWQRAGLPVNTVIYGASSPAFKGNELVIAGVGGEIAVHLIQTGDLLWADSLASLLPNTPLQRLGDILAHPVHDGKQVYVISQSGRFGAFDAQSGYLLWEHPFAGSQMPWIAGDSLYLVTLTGRLISVRLSDGAIIWVSELKGALPEGKVVGNNAPVYLGPIVASGQVHLLSGKGRIYSFDVLTGNAVGSASISGQFTTPPTAVSNNFVTLSTGGKLSVMR